jgi:hypothetical protein
LKLFVTILACAADSDMGMVCDSGMDPAPTKNLDADPDLSREVVPSWKILLILQMMNQIPDPNT